MATAEGPHDTKVTVVLTAHLIKIRAAKMRPHEPFIDSETDDKAGNDAMAALTETWQGFDADHAIPDGLLVHKRFESIDLKSVKTDDRDARDTHQGFIDAHALPSTKVELTVKRDELIELEPRGSKLLCLSKVNATYVDPKGHTHVVVHKTSPEDIKIALADCGPYTELKVLSVFPYGVFKSAPCTFKGAPGKMLAYMQGKTASVGNEFDSEDVMDTDKVVRGGATTNLDPLAGNDMAVEDNDKLPLGFRTNYSGNHGLNFPGGVDIAAMKEHLGFLASELVDHADGLSDSRKRVIASISWVEGPSDSINTYDAPNRLSWGLCNWITNFHASLDGELNHVSSFLYKEHHQAFLTSFGAYGFSVWYDKKVAAHPAHPSAAPATPPPDPYPGVADYKKSTIPFKTPVILFPGCHGPNVRAALTDPKTAKWENRRSLYASWVFRKAGRNQEIGGAQVQWVSYRIDVTLKNTDDPSTLTERTVSSMLIKNINPGADDKMVATREGNVDGAIKSLGLNLDRPFTDTVAPAAGTAPAAH